MKKFLLSALLASALVAASFGCKRKDAGDSKRVTVRSTKDATEPLIDEDYRFKIEWPGPGWKLLGEKDIRRLAPDAVAGAIGAGHVFSAVVVEKAPGLEIEPYARLLWENMPLEGRKLEQNGPIRFKGKDGYRYMVSGTIEGIEFRFVNTIVLRQGFAYQIITGGNSAGMTPESNFYRDFGNAFSFLPGDVKVRTHGPPVARTAGIGWRLVDGLYESPASAVRVRAAKGWRLLVGSELAQVNPAAEVGLIHDAANAYLVVLSELVGQSTADYKKALGASFRRDLGAALSKKTFATTFAGEPIELVHYPNVANPPMDYLHGVLCREQHCWQILGWSFSGSAATSIPAILDGLTAFEVMSEDEVGKLTNEIQGYANTQNTVGTDFALRGGRYHNFQHRFSWTTPPGFWRTSVGQEAREVNADAQLYFDDRSLGIQGLIIAETTGKMDAAEYHNVVVSNLTRSVAYKERSRREAKIGGQPGLVSIGPLLIDGIPMEYQVGSTVRGDRAIQVAVWGYPVFMKKHSAVVQALTDALALQDDLKATTKTGSNYSSDRHGFSLRLPSGNWKFRSQTPASIVAMSDFPTWENGKRFFGVLALTLPFTASSTNDDDGWFTDFFDQMMRDQFTKGGEPTETKVTVAGLKARRLSWKTLFRRTDAVLIKRDRTYYVLIIGGPSRDNLFDDIPTRFALRP